MSKEKKGLNKSFSFEDSMARLEKIVSGLESGDLTLEQSLASFEEGIELYKLCRAYLEAAKQKIEVLIGDDALGRPMVEPYEEDVDEEDDEDDEGKGDG
jgi:exodeoxyribonuclease VII small subunit